MSFNFKDSETSTNNLRMKRLLILLILFVCTISIFAQNGVKSDTRSENQNVFIKMYDSQNGSEKDDNEGSTNVNLPVLGTETVNFSATSDRIYITIISGTNKIKLFALTGQLLLNGDLTQGRFFIPTRKGIYFLRINNKSFKVVCK
jgi:hypothetical protein